MKILHLFGSVTLPQNPDMEACSGVVWNTLQLAKVQRARGHEVVVCAPSHTPWTRDWCSVRLVGLPSVSWARMRWGNSTLDVRQPLANTLYTATRAFDIVHAHKEQYVRYLRAPVKVVHVDSNPLSNDAIALPEDARIANLKTLDHSADAIIAVSHYIADQLRTAYPFSIPIKIVGNGVDTKTFGGENLTEARAAWRSQWHIQSADDLVFLYCGAIIAEKGVLELVEAFLNLLSAVPNAHLVIAGSQNLWTRPQAKPFDYIEKIQRLALRAASHIHFTGPVGHDVIAQIYQAADVVVIPSTDQEASPLVALEAMASATPVVATTVGGIPELVSGVGTLVSPNDSEALRNAMEALARHPDTRLEQATLGRQRVLPRSWENMERAINDVYQELLVSRGRKLKRRPPLPNTFPGR